MGITISLSSKFLMHVESWSITFVSKTKILFIGTVKQLGERRYYFESSQEFFESINRIYNGLIKYKELFEINLRIRDVNNEINNEILKNALFKKNDLIKIDNSIFIISKTAS